MPFQEQQSEIRTYDLEVNIPPAAGETIDFLLIAPGHNFITAIETTATGDPWQSIKDPIRRIWTLTRMSPSPHPITSVRVHAMGDHVVLLNKGSIRSSALRILDGSNEAVCEHDETLGAVFSARARMLEDANDNARAMFARYDAWGNPGLLGWLQVEGHNLDALAKRWFDPVTNGILSSYGPSLSVVQLLESMGLLLRPIPFDRAKATYRGSPMPVLFPLSQATNDWYCRHGMTFDEHVLALAEHQKRILQATFPDLRSHWLDIEDAILRFCTGMLRCKELIQPTFLNFEPDGDQVFLFAEFGCQAWRCSRSRDDTELWRIIARAFASVQPVFSDCYRGVTPSFRRDAYRPDRYVGTRCTTAQLQERLQRFTIRSPGLEEVVAETANNAFDAFKEDVKEAP